MSILSTPLTARKSLEDPSASPGGHQAARSHTEAPRPTVRGTRPRRAATLSEGSFTGRCAPNSRDGASLYLTPTRKLQTASNDAGERSEASPLYPMVKLSFNQWKGRVHHHLCEFAESYGAKARSKVKRRATAISLCGNFVAAKRCSDCSAPIPNSAYTVFRTPKSSRVQPCNSGICPVCNRIRAVKKAHALLEALKTLPTYPHYSFKALTLTFKYDPSNIEHLTVDALHARAVFAGKSVKEAWSFLMGPKGSRGWLKSNVEIAGFGNVHVHLLCYCPYIPKVELESRLSKLVCSVEGITAGHTWIEDLGSDPSSPLVTQAVWEVCKYNAKGPSSLSEAFYDRATPREVMDPRLSAAWEVATTDGRFSRIQLSQTYGDLRGHVSTDDTVTSDDESLSQSHEEPSKPCCPQCGSNNFQDVLEWSSKFIEDCHSRGYGALQHSRWEPWRDRGPG